MVLYSGGILLPKDSAVAGQVRSKDSVSWFPILCGCVFLFLAGCPEWGVPVCWAAVSDRQSLSTSPRRLPCIPAALRRVDLQQFSEASAWLTQFPPGERDPRASKGLDFSSRLPRCRPTVATAVHPFVSWQWMVKAWHRFLEQPWFSVFQVSLDSGRLLTMSDCPTLSQRCAVRGGFGGGLGWAYLCIKSAKISALWRVYLDYL